MKSPNIECNLNIVSFAASRYKRRDEMFEYITVKDILEFSLCFFRRDSLFLLLFPYFGDPKNIYTLLDAGPFMPNTREKGRFGPEATKFGVHG